MGDLFDKELWLYEKDDDGVGPAPPRSTELAATNIRVTEGGVEYLMECERCEAVFPLEVEWLDFAKLLLGRVEAPFQKKVRGFAVTVRCEPCITRLIGQGAPPHNAEQQGTISLFLPLQEVAAYETRGFQAGRIPQKVHRAVIARLRGQDGRRRRPNPKRS